MNTPETADKTVAPKWMFWCLVLAGAYNLAWGGWTVLFPHSMFDLMGMERTNYPQIWQCVGMIVGVYGIGYLIAARAPLVHWPIVLVGFLGKIFGPIGMADAVWHGSLPAKFALTCVFNDLVWWVPFGLILLGAWRVNRK
jgi:small multidrug resistance pump